MDSNIDLKTLLQRQREIQDAMRRPGGVRVTTERELLTIHEQLRRQQPVGADLVSSGMV